jgi:hypothetical protein
VKDKKDFREKRRIGKKEDEMGKRTGGKRKTKV